MIAALHSSPSPYWRTRSHRRKNFDANCTISYVLLRGHWTESYHISTRCTEMTADYSAKIKIVIFKSVLERQRDECRTSSNCGRIAAKIARFNRENSEIVGRKFTIFGYDVAWLLPLNHLKADLWLANSLSNTEGKSKGHSTRRRLYNFLCLKLRGHWTESHQISTRCTKMIADYSAEIKIAIFKSASKRQCHEWRLSSNCGRIAAKIARFNNVNSEITGRKFTKFAHDVAWLFPLNLLKVDLWSANPLSNAEAKSKGGPTRRLRTSPIFNWLP